MPEKKTVFVSDAHFGIDLGEYSNREELFLKFLDREAPSMQALYILGDLFDFWIEYHYAIRPDYFNILHGLKQLTDNGIEVHYLAGNHDFALGQFLTEVIGVTIHLDEYVATIGEKRIFMYHGDGLLKIDVGYRILKKLLRSRINQRIYKLLHPDIGIPLARYISGSGRKYLHKSLYPYIQKQYATFARRTLQKGFDMVLYGHTHFPDYIWYPEGIYCNIGAWLKHYSYAVMRGDKLELRRFQEKDTDYIFPEKLLT